MWATMYEVPPAGPKSPQGPSFGATMVVGVLLSGCGLVPVLDALTTPRQASIVVIVLLAGAGLLLGRQRFMQQRSLKDQNPQSPGEVVPIPAGDYEMRPIPSLAADGVVRDEETR